MFDARHLHSRHSYLKAVLCSRTLFSKGVTGFTSGRCSSYYTCLLKVQCDLPEGWSAKQYTSRASGATFSVAPTVVDAPSPASSDVDLLSSGSEKPTAKKAKTQPPSPLATPPLVLRSDESDNGSSVVELLSEGSPNEKEDPPPIEPVFGEAGTVHVFIEGFQVKSDLRTAGVVDRIGQGL